MKSLLDKSEGQENIAHKFGEGDLYFPCWIQRRTGNKVKALFTRDAIDEAIFRAEKNPEDWPVE